MSVLIKDMEMPALCQECDLYIDGACYAKGYRDYRSIMDMSKPDDCPLIEVPPHGRLIDADKFKADHSMKNDCAECEKELQGSSRACEYDRIYSKMDFCQWIDNAETVIEPEGRE